MRSFVSIVLVEPENHDNIGAVARAMKNTGLRDLRLVRPVAGWRAGGKKMAVSALDVLEAAQEYDRLEEAVADMKLVIGTSRREGAKRGKQLAYSEAVRRLGEASVSSRAALVFGRESKGLDNASLACCDWRAAIPSDPAYPSLNLAQAVMVFAFSLFVARSPGSSKADSRDEFLSQKEVQGVLKKLETAFRVLGYEREGNGNILPRVVATFHALFKRARLMPHEAQMFRGLTRRITEKDFPRRPAA